MIIVRSPEKVIVSGNVKREEYPPSVTDEQAKAHFAAGTRPQNPVKKATRKSAVNKPAAKKRTK